MQDLVFNANTVNSVNTVSLFHEYEEDETIKTFRIKRLHSEILSNYDSLIHKLFIYTQYIKLNMIRGIV